MSEQYDTAANLEGVEPKSLQELFDRVTIVAETSAGMLEDIATGKREIPLMGLCDFLTYTAMVLEQLIVAVAVAHKQLGKNTMINIRSFDAAIEAITAEPTEPEEAGDPKSKFN